MRYGLLDKVGMAVKYVPCFITRNLSEEIFQDSGCGFGGRGEGKLEVRELVIMYCESIVMETVRRELGSYR